MQKFIPFTESQKAQAAAVNLEEFLLRRGEELIKSGREKRLVSDHSITVRGSEWYDHAAEKGGNAISFVKNFYGVNYPQAVTMLLDESTNYPTRVYEEKLPKPFSLPPKNENNRRVYAYLVKHRKIDPAVLSEFTQRNLIYEDADYHNAVFVGTDENGVARHAHKRSTNSYGKAFRMNVEGSDPKRSFHWFGTSGRLYVFEAPIDLLSYISMRPKNWQEHSYVACCGTSSQPMMEMLRCLSKIDQVNLCLDNDRAGNSACERMREMLKNRDFEVNRLTPQHKDWNDDLTLRDEQAQGFSMQEMR